MIKQRPDGSEEAYFGCSHTESYADEPNSIVCVEGWMIDVDVYTEGWQPHDFKHPCCECNYEAFERFIQEKTKCTSP